MTVSVTLVSVFARISIPIGIMGTIFWFVESPSNLFRNLLRTDLFSLIYTAIGAFVGIVIQWWKWHMLLVAAGVGPRARHSLGSLLIGFSFGMISPGRLGEVGRGALFKGYRAEGVALASIDRIFSALVTVAFAVVSLVFFDRLAFICAAIVLIAFLFAFFKLVKMGTGWERSLKLPVKSTEFIQRVISTFPLLQNRILVQLVTLSVFFNLVFFSQFYVLCGAWDLPSRVIVAIPMVFGLKTLAPVGLFDLGTREAAAVVAFSKMELEVAIALKASLLLWFMNVVVPAFVGLFCMARGGVEAMRQEESVKV